MKVLINGLEVEGEVNELMTLMELLSAKSKLKEQKADLVKTAKEYKKKKKTKPAQLHNFWTKKELALAADFTKLGKLINKKNLKESSAKVLLERHSIPAIRTKITKIKNVKTNFLPEIKNLHKKMVTVTAEEARDRLLSPYKVN